ncbi:hypothetical protein [Poseidonibacter antarcticus]|uniref:hypothetical protein n=1 Tax=Poseidonibacter antarcticus TaxID=2478538 RepID=UPI000EF4B8DE|nr:hypothetical protein [Poseidonibacter antarcticus]
MKKILPFLTIIIIIAVIVIIFLSMSNKKQMVVIHEGNHTHQPVDIKLNHFQDSQCGMTIVNKRHSAQAVAPDGRTWFFDDVGCMSLWYHNIKFQKEATLWVYTNDTNEYINARDAWYMRTDTTPMNYGFGANKVKQEGYVDFEAMILMMLRGENLTNPYIKKELMSK